MSTHDAMGQPATLTSALTAPLGVSYRWQEWTGGAWTNLGSTTTRQTVTSSVRGTRKFRVVASHATATSATSSPVYVTWDEWAIVGEMIGKLSAAVATSTTYKAAQTALLKCMNGSTGGGPIKAGASSTTPAYTSFDDILGRYASSTKTKMDGECSATSTAMFSANAITTRAELAKLKAGSTMYAALLDTPYGRHFQANAGDPDELKLVAYLGAATFEPGELVAPLYDSSDNDGGAGGDSITTPPAVIPRLGTGLGCLPAGVDGEALTVSNQLVVLNCLVFSTPHSFWRESYQALRADPRYNTWLSYGGEDICSSSANTVIAACRKHDVMWGSLKAFEGKEADGELDIIWNPRNKLLADIKLLTDARKYDCDRGLLDPSDLPLDLPDLARIICTFTSSEVQANMMGFGLRDLLEVLSRTILTNTESALWPVTRQDLEHTSSLPRFVVCREPVPWITEVRLDSQTVRGNGKAFTALWSNASSCVQGIKVDARLLNWRIHFHEAPLDDPYNRISTPFETVVLGSASSSEVNTSELSGSDLYPLATATLESVWTQVSADSDVLYGGTYYKQQLSLNSEVE